MLNHAWQPASNLVRGPWEVRGDPQPRECWQEAFLPCKLLLQTRPLPAHAVRRQHQPQQPQPAAQRAGSLGCARLVWGALKALRPLADGVGEALDEPRAGALVKAAHLEPRVRGSLPSSSAATAAIRAAAAVADAAGLAAAAAAVVAAAAAAVIDEPAAVWPAAADGQEQVERCRHHFHFNRAQQAASQPREVLVRSHGPRARLSAKRGHACGAAQRAHPGVALAAALAGAQHS